MGNPYNLKVGQKLWYVPNDSRYESAREYTVKKVGRLFAELADSQRRIRLDNLEVYVPNYSSPGRCYLSQEEYAAEVALGRAWWDFKKRVDEHYRAPKGMTLERIAQAQALLFEGVD
jgi:hypothetical protein